jgi:cell division protease FtsH
LNKNNNPKKWRNSGLYALLAILLAIVVIALASAFFERQPASQETWHYEKFINKVRSGKVERVSLNVDRTKAIVLAQDGRQVLVNLPNDPQLIDLLSSNNVDISVTPQKDEGVWVRLLSSLFLPIFLQVGLFFLAIAIFLTLRNR